MNTSQKIHIFFRKFEYVNQLKKVGKNGRNMTDFTQGDCTNLQHDQVKRTFRIVFKYLSKIKIPRLKLLKFSFFLF
jgi:hypothetical protein